MLQDRNKIVWNVLGALRLQLAEEMGLLDKNEFRFVWITEFPLLEWSDEEKRFMAMHHPFTMPMEEDWDKIDTDPGSVRAKAYDIVLNGNEIGGGSVRIHQNDIQEKMFEVLGFTREQAWEQFSFLLTAFKYGVPPHAGPGLWPGPAGDAHGRRGFHPRRDRLPEGERRFLPDDRGPGSGGCQTAGGAGDIRGERGRLTAETFQNNKIRIVRKQTAGPVWEAGGLLSFMPGRRKKAAGGKF